MKSSDCFYLFIITDLLQLCHIFNAILLDLFPIPHGGEAADGVHLRVWGNHIKRVCAIEAPIVIYEYFTFLTLTRNE